MTRKQQAALMRGSEIRTLRMLQQRVRICRSDRAQEIIALLDQELWERGAETLAEYQDRRERFFLADRSEKDWVDFQKSFGGKHSHKITEEDLQRYRTWS